MLRVPISVRMDQVVDSARQAAAGPICRNPVRDPEASVAPARRIARPCINQITSIRSIGRRSPRAEWQMRIVPTSAAVIDRRCPAQGEEQATALARVAIAQVLATPIAPAQGEVASNSVPAAAAVTARALPEVAIVLAQEGVVNSFDQVVVAVIAPDLQVVEIAPARAVVVNNFVLVPAEIVRSSAAVAIDFLGTITDRSLAEEITTPSTTEISTLGIASTSITATTATAEETSSAIVPAGTTEGGTIQAGVGEAAAGAVVGPATGITTPSIRAMAGTTAVGTVTGEVTGTGRSLGAP